MSNLSKQIANLPPEKRELLEMMLLEQGVDLSQVLIVPQSRETNTFPLSFSQQRLWFLDKLEPGSPLYNIPAVLRLRGRLNLSALEKSFNEVIRRHEVLRTTFGEKEGQPFQIIHDQGAIKINRIHLKGLPEKERSALLQQEAIKEANQPFDLSTGPLLRVTLLQFSDEDHALFVIMHHIVSDNWSTALFVHEILQLYRGYLQGISSSLPQLAVQYADFAVWQRKWLQGKTLDKQLAYWRDKLSDIPPLLDMPLDKSRPGFQTFHGDYKLFDIPDMTVKRITALSKEQDVTLFMTLLAAFYSLLYRYTGQDDICIGSPVANRNRKETENLIGFFVNTLVLRASINGDMTFRELLQQVKKTTLEAQEHQDLPFEILVEELDPERDMSRSPLFQVMFVMNNVPVDTLQLPDLEIEIVEIENKTAKFDLILNVTEATDGLHCKLEYNTDLFISESMKRLIEHYLLHLSSLLNDPGKPIKSIPLLTEDERHLVLEEWNRSEKQYDEHRTIAELFRNQVYRTPEATALRISDQKYSYEELNGLSNQLARHLIKQGLKNGQIVGVNANRSPEMIIAFLAILKTGAVYLPLDPTYPVERLKYMMADSRADFLLTQSQLSTNLTSEAIKTVHLDLIRETIADEDSGDMEDFPPAQDTAYIIYTSGSTGQPKGVEISQQALANHCLDMAEYYQLTAEDNVLQFAALNFDASIEQILAPLISGSTVCMRDDEIWDSFQFARVIEKYNLTVINPPTVYWAQLAADWAQKPESVPENNLRLVIIGGDVLKTDALQNWYKTPLKKVRLLNAYGPTEATITATTFEIPYGFSADRVPIGRPRANRILYVLDKDGNPVPPGVAGELYIGGSVLAKGYLYRPQLTAQKFINDPFSEIEGRRLYRTGDRVRFLPDGNLEFLGRIDFQVKIRGFRIELGEIESVLIQMPQIRQSIVQAVEDNQHNKRLVAYYVSEQSASLTKEQIREFLSARLPEYMIPSVFIELSELPLDPSGKINRRALPQPDPEHLAIKTEYVAPRTPTEEKLCLMIKNILQIERVGVHDSFFDLGGHSMMATQVVSRIREEFEVEISLRTLFEHPTAAGIAQAIAEVQAEALDENELNKLLDEIENLSDNDLEKYLEEN